MPVANAREVFEVFLPQRLQANPELATKIGATFKFVVEGAATFVVDLTQAGGKVTEGDGEAACTITLDEQTLVDVVNQTTNPQMAFMGGKLKVAGDMGLAMKLGALFG